MLQVFKKSILAGIMIAISGIMYLNVDSMYVKAILYGFALATIVTFNFSLFTGKIGYIFHINTKEAYSEIAITLLGNFVGVFIASLFVVASNNQNIIEKAISLYQTKMGFSSEYLLVASVFCGILMFVAVHGFTLTKNYLFIFLPITIFILAGFEHCIANMVYFSISLDFSLKAILTLLIIILGNAAGSLLISFLILEKDKKYEQKR